MEDNRINTGRLTSKIAAAAALIPLALFTLNQFMLQIYNTAHSRLSDRLGYAVQPTIYLLYFTAAAIIVFVIIRQLRPLYRYINDGSDYNKARKSMLRIPWILIIINTGLWLFTITLFYALQGFSTKGGVPYLWSLLTNSLSGCISATLASLVINRILIPAKIALDVTDIRQGEKDLFVRIKIPLVFITGFIYTIITLIYGARFFAAEASGAIPSLPLTFLPSMLLTALLGGVPILLNLSFSVSEDRIQRKFLLDRMKVLTGGSGELSTKVSLINFDETGELAAIINIFIEKIRTLIIKAEHAGSQIVETSNDIGQLLSQLSSATNTMLEAINSFENEMGQQENEIVKVKSALDTFFTVLTELTDNIDSQSGSVEQTSRAVGAITDSITSGAVTVKEIERQTGSLTEISAVGSSHIAEFIDAIRAVERSSQKVEEILEQMKTLSEQIDILAMNAAIEAAHAGESGKGFAVVAEEVRRLSENNDEQSGQISAQMTEMMNSLSEGNAKTQLADEAFSEIHSSIEKTADQFQKVLNSTKNEEESVEQLTATVKHLVHLTESIRNIAEIQQQQNDEIKTGIEKVFSMFGGLKTSMNAQRENRDLVSSSLSRLQSITEENLKVVQELNIILKQFKL